MTYTSLFGGIPGGAAKQNGATLRWAHWMIAHFPTLMVSV